MKKPVFGRALTDMPSLDMAHTGQFSPAIKFSPSADGPWAVGPEQL
jgi:hypothetical protein